MQGVSMRSEVEGIVTFQNMKLSPARKVLLPGAFIFVYPEDIPDEETLAIEFKKPFLKTALKSSQLAGLTVQNSDQVDVDEELAAVYAPCSGTVIVKKKEVMIKKQDGTDAFSFDPTGFKILVNNGDTVSTRAKIASLVSPVEGVIRTEVNRNKLVTCIQVKPGEAYEVEEDFTVKVKEGQIINEGALLAVGYLD